MTRRTLITIAALAVLLLVAPVASAHTTIIEPLGSHFPYQRWIDESEVPTPDVTIEVIETQIGCPAYGGEFGVACTDTADHLIWISTGVAGFHPRQVFMHEVGHNFDSEDLADWGRERFDAIYGLSGPWSNEDEPEAMTPSEWFAEAYAECSVKPYIAGSEWEGGYAPVVYGGQPIFDRRQAHNRACRLIQSF